MTPNKISNEERAVRLELLASALQKVDEKRFDIGTWGTTGPEAYEEERIKQVKQHPDEAYELCGTTACALGWGALDQEVSERLGLRMVMQIETRGDNFHWERESHIVRSLNDMAINVVNKVAIPGLDRRVVNFDVVYSPDGTLENCEGRTGFDSAKIVFYIDDMLAEFLFLSANYDRSTPITASRVAKRLKWLADFSRARTETSALYLEDLEDEDGDFAIPKEIA